ncbi:glycoside hydrolase family 47 protein [Chaetomium fimeti]|uniref:alpha-1,2-Mannosidase n=1 Tax=Chaetomium fimeti TaxID=1854472 RepID=A0AAE0HJF6_9PEZI|nr:glycoside hydrolase family 47 protein [Chaetomium fimeti]
MAGRKTKSPRRPSRQPTPPSRVRSPVKYIIAGLTATAALGWGLGRWYADNPIGFSHHAAPYVDWDARREEVKEAFSTSWEAYSQYAWGKDRYHPVSGKGSQMSPKGLGWIIVDSLDTMMIMNLTEPLAESRKWLHRSLTYDQDQDVNTFETTIRMLGGLLSAHYLAGRLPDVASRRDSIYLTKAVDLAERLLAAYESRSGIPYASVHLGRKVGLPSHADGGSSSMAEAATLQLEMKYLSHITGDERYWRRAEKVMQVLDDNAMEAGLLPIFVHPDTGRFTTAEIRLGSRGDSYYEYLIKQHLQTSEPIYLTMWQEALAGIETHLITTTRHSHLKIVAELPQGIGGPLSPKMDHLVCFLPGAIALGATGGHTVAHARADPTWTARKETELALARDLMKTCWGMYAGTASGLAPEIVWFDVDERDLRPRPGDRAGDAAAQRDSLKGWKRDFVIKPLDAHNLQRPETVESLYVMWRVTGDPVYREWGWKIFESFREWTKAGLDRGYTAVGDVRTVPPPLRDEMESFWLAETLKYLYLLFSPTDFLPLEEVVFNTEAHIFPRFKSQWETGWERNR